MEGNDIGEYLKSKIAECDYNQLLSIRKLVEDRMKELAVPTRVQTISNIKPGVYYCTMNAVTFIIPRCDTSEIVFKCSKLGHPIWRKATIIKVTDGDIYLGGFTRVEKPSIDLVGEGLTTSMLLYTRNGDLIDLT